MPDVDLSAGQRSTARATHARNPECQSQRNARLDRAGARVGANIRAIERFFHEKRALGLLRARDA